MATKILVAGATGDMAGRIIMALIARGAEVQALVRTSADPAKVAKVEALGAKVVYGELTDKPALTTACEGVACVVSALQGLHDVIVVGQSLLVDAAIAAGVPRFIPSDYASDLTLVKKGENRNFDLRREFHEYLDKQTAIKGTSILNGAFADMLKWSIPFLNFKNHTIGYVEDPDWRVDFTTMDNTAAFTAAAALDTDTPRILRIAGFQISAKEMQSVAIEIFHAPFALVNMGTLDGLAANNIRERAAHPEGENEVFPNWQRAQYMHSMFSVQLSPLDNDRYPDIQWTTVREVIAK